MVRSKTNLRWNLALMDFHTYFWWTRRAVCVLTTCGLLVQKRVLKARLRVCWRNNNSHMEMSFNQALQRARPSCSRCNLGPVAARVAEIGWLGTSKFGEVLCKRQVNCLALIGG